MINSQEENLGIGIQVPSSWKLSFKIKFSLEIRPFFKQLMRPLLTPVRMGMDIRMPQLKNWKIKGFTLKNETIKEGILIQVTLHFEIQLQKVHF